MQSNVATPKDIAMDEVEVGDIIRVTYVEPNDPENPDSSATEITIKGKVERMNASGFPMIHLRSHKGNRSWSTGTELSLETAHTLKPHLVTLLDRPFKPSVMEDREYYLTDNWMANWRITVKGGVVTHVRAWFASGALKDPLDNNYHWPTVLRCVYEGRPNTFKITAEPKRFDPVPGKEYVAKARPGQKVNDINFTGATDFSDKPDATEYLTGVGRWEYPEEYINPRQAVINRAKAMGVKPENIYGCYGREKYGVDAEGYTLYSSYNHGFIAQWDLYRIQEDPMKILDGIEKGYLVLERP